jgi:hypothetical protein
MRDEHVDLQTAMDIRRIGLDTLKEDVCVVGFFDDEEVQAKFAVDRAGFYDDLASQCAAEAKRLKAEAAG